MKECTFEQFYKIFGFGTQSREVTTIVESARIWDSKQRSENKFQKCSDFGPKVQKREQFSKTVVYGAQSREVKTILENVWMLDP
jgi:hypothetical protein